MKKKLLSLVQLAIGIALIAFICSRMQDKSDLLQALRTAAQHWPLLMAAAGCFLVCLAVVTLRWQLLLNAQGLTISFGRVFVLTFIGHFFNSFMFGSTGGDVAKAIYATAEMPNKKAEAASTVFIDRLVGLLALVFLVVLIMTVRLPLFLKHRDTRIALVISVVLLFGTVIGLFAVFRQNLFERWAIFRRLEHKTSLGRIISKIYNAFHVCFSHSAVLLKTIMLSLVNQLILITGCFCLGRALEIHLSFINGLTMYPLINAFAAIPMTPGGLGTRELAAKHLLAVFNVPDTRAVFLAWLIYAMIMFWSLVGGIVYLRYVYRHGKADVQGQAGPDPSPPS